MYSPVKLGINYLRYYLTAANGKGHGVHSPFVFDFITKVLNDNRQFYSYKTIEQLRDQLKTDKTEIELQDLGAGSRVHTSYKRKVADIARSSLKPMKYGQLLFRMINFYQPSTTLELGTSFGITTAYLAAAKPDANVVTMEGAASVAEIAQKNFQKLQLGNIKIVRGNFDDTLPNEIALHANIDFAFIDGNHRKEPTLNYFHQLLSKITTNTILIFDDIHWSREMEEAWETIKAHTSVTLSIDLFFIGIIFFREEQKVKQHFTIRF